MLLADPALRLQFFYGYAWSDRMMEQLNQDGENSVRRQLLRSAGHVVRLSVLLFGSRVAILRRQILSQIERMVFQRGIASFRPAVIHATNNYIYRSDVPTVITVHDISCFRHPETHPEQRVRWQQENLPGALSQAAHILAVSDFTKNELIDYFGIKPEKITVTHNGVDDSFKPRPSIEVSAALSRFGLSRQQYILTVSTIEPRKNLDTLVKAYTQLPKPFRLSYPLVVVGMRGWKEAPFIKSLEPLIKEGSARLLGYVDQRDIPLLFNGASTFVYPSIYEGFGIPVAEAMASGAPVIASNSSSLPEVLGESGLLVESRNVQGWTNALRQMLLDADLRETMAKRGIERAKLFTWEQCAQRTLSVYRHAFDNQ